MSSNTLTDLMPRIVARGLMRFREQAILPRLVNSSLSAEAARHGDSIRVPLSRPVTAADVAPGAQPRQAPATAMQVVNVPLDNWKSASFFLTDQEMLQIEAESGFIPLQMSEAITALANAVNETILKRIETVTTVIGSPGEVPFQNVDSPSEVWHGANAAVTARKLLNLAAAPKSGRFAVIDYEMEANALGLPQFHDAHRSGSTGVPMEGEIGRKFGIDWFSSDLLPRSMAEIATVRVQSPVNARSTTVELKIAFAKLRIGDVLVAGSGEYAADHQITAITSANGGAHSTITVTPAFGNRVTISDDLAVKRPYRVGVAMHLDAVALAMRPLSAAGLEGGANGQTMSVSDPETGLSLRLEVTRQYKQTMWEFDILWGVKLVRPELVVAIHG
ncbi:MAG: hypothetical protein ACON37_10715 [Candidatus Puniceispirillaceae bacterium]